MNKEEIQKFRKKPVVIDALKWNGDNLKEVLEFTGKSPRFDEYFKTFEEYENHVKKDGNIFKIFTLEGTMKASVGDYIIKGVKGENYPCKPDIFESTYEVSPSLPTHKEETKTPTAEEIRNILYVDFPLVEGYSEMIDSITDSIMELIEGVSVPQPLKPLSDEEIWNISCKETLKQISKAFNDNKERGATDNDKIVFQAISETITNFPLPEFSLPVYNTVSETETQKLLNEYRMQISELLFKVEEKSKLLRHYEINVLASKDAELEANDRLIGAGYEIIDALILEIKKVKQECDFFATTSNKHELEVVTLREQVTSLTSQLSLYRHEGAKTQFFTEWTYKKGYSLEQDGKWYNCNKTVLSANDTEELYQIFLNTLKQE